MYTKAIKEATQAAAVKAAAAEAAPAESVVIESDDGDDEDAYAAFEAVEVKDKVIEEAA